MDEKPPRGRGFVLSVLLIGAWAIALATFVGGAGWLFLFGADPVEDAAAGAPRATMSMSAFREAKPANLRPGAIDPGSETPASNPDGQAPQGADGTTLAAAGLHPHPDPMLVEKSDLGPLPIIGKDGRSPWRVYARPFSLLDERPRIAVVVTRLGVSEDLTERAIEMLPGTVTLSFAPFSRNLTEWIDKSRADGHEVLIDLPMEPVDYPSNDPGPHTLLTSVPIDQNLRQLEWILTRATGYVGVSTYMGSGLSTKPRALTPILTELKSRGLLLLDTLDNPVGLTGQLAAEIGLTVAANEMHLDRQPSRVHISGRLQALEKRAKRQGAIVAIARPYPVTLESIREWLGTLNGKGIATAPVSALAKSGKSR